MCVCVVLVVGGGGGRRRELFVPIRSTRPRRFTFARHDAHTHACIQARGVKPTVVTYGTAMQALAASGRHVEAFDLLSSMKRVCHRGVVGCV